MSFSPVHASRPIPTADGADILCPLNGRICNDSKCYVHDTCEKTSQTMMHMKPCPWQNGASCYLKVCNDGPIGYCKLIDGDTKKQITLPLADSTTTGAADRSAPASIQCHYGLYHLGNIGGASIYVGREAAAKTAAQNGRISNSERPLALVISLIGENIGWTGTDTVKKDLSGEAVVEGTSAARAILPRSLFIAKRPIPFINVDWPDFGVPDLERIWWSDLFGALGKLQGDVIIYCLGGHGRTGTAASILAVMAGWSGKDACPVQWLRDTYCKSVVESDEQVAYIEHVTGCKVIAKPHKLGPIGSNVYDTSYKGAGSSVTVYRGKGKPKVKWDRPAKDKADAPELTPERYSKWVRRRLRRNKVAKPLAELLPGEVISFDGWRYRWLKALGQFNPTDAAVGPPSANLLDAIAAAKAKSAAIGQTDPDPVG